jgi:hypothetical protein
MELHAICFKRADLSGVSFPRAGGCISFRRRAAPNFPKDRRFRAAEKKDYIMRLLPTLALAAALVSGAGAQAAETLKSQLTGTWKVTSVYDQFSDGTRRETWGADPIGQLIVTPEGTFSFIMAAGDRAPKANSVPTDPVGPTIAYFGTYNVDEAKKTVSRTIIQSTFPQWKGISQVVTVDSISVDGLKVAAMPITDPAKNMTFVPHLEFARVK